MCLCGCVFMQMCLYIFICESVHFSSGNLFPVFHSSDNWLQSAALTSKHTLSVPTDCILPYNDGFVWAYIVCLCEECDFVLFPFVDVLYHDRLSYLSHHTAFFFFSFLSPSAEFSAKSEDKDGNSLAFQFLSGAKVTVQASKTSRESTTAPNNVTLICFHQCWLQCWVQFFVMLLFLKPIHCCWGR